MAEYSLKPEKSTNWEVGYNFNFARISPNCAKATSASPTTAIKSKNQIEHLEYGRWHDPIRQGNQQGGGAAKPPRQRPLLRFLRRHLPLETYGVRQEYRLKFDYYYQRVPECLEGGFGLSRFFQSLQPKYSLTLDVGTRFFNEKLELGMRAIHHSKAERKNYDKLIADGVGQVYERNGNPTAGMPPPFWMPMPATA